jgi:hypothetical protein
VVIPIEGDASGLQAAIATASASLRSLSAQAAAAAAGGMRTLETASDKAGTSAKKAATATEKYKEAAYALNKAANATGGALTFLTGPLEDVGDLLEKGGGRMAAMAIGVGVVATAMYSGAAAIAAAGRAIYDTTANASELIAQLESAGRVVLPAHRMAMLEAEKAVAGLEASHTELTLVLVSQFAPAMRDAADVIAGFNLAFASGVNDVASWSTEIDMMLDNMSLRWRAVSALADAVSDLMDVLGAPGRAAREQADAAKKVADANAEWMKGLEEHFKKEDELTKKVDAGTTARRERTIAIRQEKEAILDLAATQLDLSEFTNPDDMSANAGQSRLAAQNREEAESYALRTDAQIAATNALRAENKQVAQNKEEWSAYFDDLDQKAQTWADNARYYSGLVFSTATNLSDALTKNERKAARNRAIIQKAAAITEATINTLVAVTKALASSSPPINFVLAGIVGAVGAVNIGLIASKPLVYHRGGMLDPDEERLSQTSTIVRRNESLGIVTSAGRSATTTAVSRLNAGEVSAGDTYLMVEGDVFRTRRVGGPAPGYGRKRGVTGGR